MQPASPSSISRVSFFRSLEQTSHSHNVDYEDQPRTGIAESSEDFFWWADVSLVFFRDDNVVQVLKGKKLEIWFDVAVM